MKVTKESIIGDIIDFDEDCSEIFLEAGMHCLDCPVSRSECIEDACDVHGIDADELIAKLNAFFESKK